MAAAVARKAATKPVGHLPPASPFAELLRRSRFASYDPEIRQTYSAPPAYAQRGNWGLKRPISQRNKDAHITLKSYEDHAQFVEWNNAGAEVRFVKQFEELNMAPRNTDESIQKPFFDNLGPIQNSIWLTDSEFDEAGEGEYKHSLLEERLVQEEPGAFDGIDFSALGKKGKGKYGANMEIPTSAPLAKRTMGPWNYRQPNFDAMNESEFQAYLRKLRELRPQFLEEIRQVHADRLKRGEMNATLLDGQVSDLQLTATNCFNDDHRAFLNKFFETQWEERDTTPSAADPVTEEALPADFVTPKIKPQPHRFGGLIYSHPSLLDTFYTTQARPAFALSQGRSDRSHQQDGGMTTSKHDFTQVSMGGIVAKVEGKTPFHVRPLFSATAGPREDALSNSLLNDLRPKTISILQAPKVVGKDAEGLHGTSIKEIVAESPTAAAKGWDNAHVPGTFAYNSAITGHMPNVLNGLGSMSRVGGKGRSWKANKPPANALGNLLDMTTKGLAPEPPKSS